MSSPRTAGVISILSLSPLRTGLDAHWPSTREREYATPIHRDLFSVHTSDAHGPRMAWTYFRSAMQRLRLRSMLTPWPFVGSSARRCNPNALLGRRRND